MLASRPGHNALNGLEAISRNWSNVSSVYGVLESVSLSAPAAPVTRPAEGGWCF